MATPVLTYTSDTKLFPETAELNKDGRRVVRAARINTRNAAAALKASGVPAIGTPFDAENPDLLFRGMKIEGLGGVDLGDGTGGWCKATLEWATPSYAQDRPAVPGQPWTEIQVNVSSIGVNFAVSGYWVDTPLNNGEGVQIETGQALAIVHTFHEEEGYEIPITQLLGLCSPNKLNAEAITLPPILGSNTRLDFGPGQARYRTFALGARDGVIELQHHLVLAPDHLVRWGVKNKEGQRLGDAIPAPVYAEDDFGGLW